MVWSHFFQSRPFRYGAATGIVTCAMGAGVSAVLALKVADQCSIIIDALKIGGNVSIDKITADVEIKNHTSTLILKNIKTVLPELELVAMAESYVDYCFSIPLSLCLILTFSIALSLANVMAAIVHFNEQDKEEPSELLLRLHT